MKAKFMNEMKIIYCCEKKKKMISAIFFTRLRSAGGEILKQQTLH